MQHHIYSVKKEEASRVDRDKQKTEGVIKIS